VLTPSSGATGTPANQTVRQDTVDHRIGLPIEQGQLAIEDRAAGADRLEMQLVLDLERGSPGNSTGADHAVQVVAILLDRQDTIVDLA